MVREKRLLMPNSLQCAQNSFNPLAGGQPSVTTLSINIAGPINYDPAYYIQKGTLLGTCYEETKI